MWPYTPQAYRVIFENIINNRSSISVPFTEIQQAWEIVDPTIEQHNNNLFFYEIGSTGPQQATEYLHHITDKKIV
jgi:glucose-6-phosphate 1-dehydrogenase